MPKRSNSLISAFWSGLFYYCSAMGVSAEPLQGNVNMSHELPPIPNELCAGAIFNEANLPPMGTNQEWRKIPSWYAGTWHREMQTNLLPTGTEIKLSRTLDEQQAGEQVDRNGGIWTHVSLPSKATIEGDNYIEYQITTDSETILNNETQMVRRVRFMALDVKKSNNRIARVFQKEELDTGHPEGQGRVFQDAWLTVYNERGRRLYIQHSQANYYQIHPFAPINIDPKTGLDLRQDFRNYLLSRRLANLIPVDEEAQISKVQAVTY